jgi:hypothetical protein
VFALYIVDLVRASFAQLISLVLSLLFRFCRSVLRKKIRPSWMCALLSAPLTASSLSVVWLSALPASLQRA